MLFRQSRLIAAQFTAWTIADNILDGNLRVQKYFRIVILLIFELRKPLVLYQSHCFHCKMPFDFYVCHSKCKPVLFE